MSIVTLRGGSGDGSVKTGTVAESAEASAGLAGGDAGAGGAWWIAGGAGDEGADEAWWYAVCVGATVGVRSAVGW